jgi:hypothetical protein
MRTRIHIALNAILIAAIVSGAALQGAEPDSPGGSSAVVVSPQWLGFPGAFAAIVNAGGVAVSENASGSVAKGFSEDPEFRTRLRREGALLVFNISSVPGCARQP